MDRSGQLLGKYRLMQKLVNDQGGMSEVYQAFDATLGRDVAIKILSLNLAQDEHFVRRFQQEVRALARLDHPHIVAVYDADQQGQLHYLVMEYVEGGSLTGVISREAPLPLDRAVQVVVQVAAALDYAHAQRMIHRDIKPANILIDTYGNAKLSDFGLVKIDDSTLTIAGQRYGTPHYMAPEQIDGAQVGPWTDVYSLAVVAYELLTGHAPFQGDPVTIFNAHLRRSPMPMRQLNETLPLAVDEVVLRALRKAPDQRYPSAGAFGHALEMVAQETVVPVQQRSIPRVTPVAQSANLPTVRAAPPVLPPEVPSVPQVVAPVVPVAAAPAVLPVAGTPVPYQQPVPNRPWLWAVAGLVGVVLAFGLLVVVVLIFIGG